MIQKRKIAVAMGLAMCSTLAVSATKVADGRGNGMGNTGVASSDYLVAPFYNPAMGAFYRDSDDVGILLPAIGANLRDSDESVDTIDDFQDTYKGFDESTASVSTLDKLNGYLDDLQNNKPLTATGGAGIAVAIPSDTVSTNIFARGFVEIIGVTTGVADLSVGSSPTRQEYAEATKTRVEASNVELVAFGYSEFGVSFSKLLEAKGQTFSLGVSPKYQELKTYYQNVNVNDFDLDDYDESEISDTAFNLDLGAVWYKDAWKVGFALKDIFKQEISTQFNNYTYELKPQATVAAAYTTRFFTAAIDADLTKQTRYTNVDDDTQFIRFGIEGNAWDWLQLRAGYEIDTQDTLDESVTAGIGISPFDVLNIDVAGSYAGDNQFGGSANLAFTF
ncbi:conjugal transfer protein TraF [Vibrio hannami]|uniref:conjugal transfer protein TraF n=1 Tax=Vibrio hannami TaxID=2717094 RepID=UPI00240EC62A|nr:conjugal transfer protein TraF [Vibrio hannami]MDG3085217.1 conjugal transfer protein TraF [Vibrio hannami]